MRFQGWTAVKLVFAPTRRQTYDHSGYKYRSGVCVRESMKTLLINSTLQSGGVCVFVSVCRTSCMAQCRLWIKAQA